MGTIISKPASAGGGGVTQVVAGTNVTVSPGGGTGTVTINASGAVGSNGVNMPTAPISGFSYSNSIITGSNAVSPGVNNITLTLFKPNNAITVSGLSVECTTASAGATLVILVYSDVNGMPTTKLIESTAISCATTGVKTFATSYTFAAGTSYWIGTNGDNFSSLVRSNQYVPIFASDPAAGTVYGAWNFSGILPTANPTTLPTATSGNLYSVPIAKINFISV